MVDVKPRQLPRECCQLLCNMCELLMRQYERQSSEVVHAAYASHSESANLNAAVLVVEVETPGWPIRYANAAWQDLAGQFAAQPEHNAILTAHAQSQRGVPSQQATLCVEEWVPAVETPAQMSLQQ